MDGAKPLPTVRDQEKQAKLVLEALIFLPNAMLKMVCFVDDKIHASKAVTHAKGQPTTQVVLAIKSVSLIVRVIGRADVLQQAKESLETLVMKKQIVACWA